VTQITLKIGCPAGGVLCGVCRSKTAEGGCRVFGTHLQWSRLAGCTRRLQVCIDAENVLDAERATLLGRNLARGIADAAFASELIRSMEREGISNACVFFRLAAGKRHDKLIGTEFASFTV